MTHEAEKQERFIESFYTQFDRSVRLLSRSPRWSGRGDETGRGAQLTRMQAVLSAVSNTNLRSVSVGDRLHVLLGTCKLRPQSDAMSARDWDIMQENVPLDKNGRAIAQVRREGETRAHVRGVRARLARSPKTCRNGEAPRKPFRETSERCER